MEPKAGPISCLERRLTTSTPKIASFDHLAWFMPSNQRVPVEKHSTYYGKLVYEMENQNV